MLDIPNYTLDQVNTNWHVDKRNIVLDNEGHIVHEPCNPAWAGAPVVSDLITVAPKLLHLLMEYVRTDETSYSMAEDGTCYGHEGNEPWDALRNDAEELIKHFYPNFRRNEPSVYLEKYGN